MFFRVHKPRDSILSWGSDFDRYEGVINWGGLLLFLGGLRLSLENFNKYGIRVDPYEWLYALFGHVDIFSEDQEYPTLFIILCKSSSFCYFCFLGRYCFRPTSMAALSSSALACLLVSINSINILEFQCSNTMVSVSTVQPSINLEFLCINKNLKL